MMYILNDSNPAVRQFKILNIVVLLAEIMEPVREFSNRIVLYGSYSRGENAKDSDVDILIIGNRKEEIKEPFKLYLSEDGKEGIKVQAVIKSTAEWMALEKRAPTFFSGVAKGIVLWDKQKRSARRDWRAG